MSLARYQVSTDVRVVSDLSMDLTSILGSDDFALILSRSAALNSSLVPAIEEFAPKAKVLVSPVESEPSVKWLESHFQTFSQSQLDQVVAIGGGSCIDAAKVLAAASVHRGDASIYELTKNHPQATRATPKIVAIPTTAGTGSEVTSFATVWDRIGRKKLSVDHASLTPSHALLTPDALSSLTSQVAVPPLLDAMSHAFESLWNSDASDFSETHACAALRSLFKYGPSFLKGSRDTSTLRQIQCAATHAGIAIQQTRTSIAHAVSYPLTLNKGIPHGHACSFLLPAIWTYVVAGDPERYATLSAALGHISFAETRRRIQELLDIGQTQRTLRAAGVKEPDINIDDIQQYSRSQNFSAPISSDVLLTWVQECL